MVSPEETADQRQNERFQVREGAFVLLGPDSTKLGRVIDISMGGLSFSHMGKARPPSDLVELDVFLIDADFYLEMIPFQVVSDFKTRHNPLSPITMRRCGVQFKELTYDQRSQLEHFIQNYTLNEARVNHPA